MAVANSPPLDSEVPRQAWTALALTTLVIFLVVVDVSVVNVAFPSISEDLDASETTLSWVISGYNIGVAAFLLIAGRLADSLGRRKVFVPGLVVFAIGSLLSGLAPSAGLLIAARVVQAIGGAILSPSSLAVVLPEFPPSKRSAAIGVWGAMGALGAAFGPAFGSFLIDVGSWRLVFLINVPICLFVLVMTPRYLRESKDPDATGNIDYIATPVGALGLGMVMLGIVQSESWGLTDWRVVTLFVIGLALVGLLIRRSATHPEPLLDLKLFRLQSFSSVNAGVALYSLAFTAGFLVSSLLLQQMWDQSIIATGLALTPSPLLATFVSIPAGRFGDRYGHRWLLGTGTALCGTAYLLFLLLLGTEPDVWSRFVPISMVLGLGVGLSIASWSSAGLSDVSTGKFGVANATIRTTQQLFYALGISVLVTLLAAGGSRSELTGFRWGWAWVMTMYFAGALVIMIAFPAGSATDRSAGGDLEDLAR